MISKAWDWTEPEAVPFQKFFIEREILICKNEGNCQLTLDLSKLKSVEQLEKFEETFQLKFTGNYVECQGFEERHNDTHFAVIDSEMRPRVIKAFKHLAYLATEKRKAAREASGEKF